MQKLAKRLSVFMVALMTVSTLLGFAAVPQKAQAAPTYPQVQYATEPKLEYEVGDIVNFDLYTPNYGGRVQYRVVLWNDETKSYKDLWTASPDRYYTNWMPYGNNIFNLHWKIDVAGHYRITIYAKRAGVPNNETFLKGFNCDSYMESDSFVVKAKEVPKEEPKPDVASEKIELASVTTSPAVINGHASKSAQAIIGKDYELAVKVDKPGVKVMFQLDAPDGSLNKDDVLEAVSGSDNVAKISYKRLYADADYVTAYVAAAPTVRTAMKVYWGVTKVLDIAATDTDAANALNGNVKSYKVTLKNPITGEKMRDKYLRVLIRENIDAPNNAALSTALIVNPYSGVKLGTYQRMNNIVTGGLNEETIQLVTNDNGEAVFTVTGINTKATPVVFYDYDWFYSYPDDSGWGGLDDSSQYKPSYSGNDNNRWDATELQVEPATVSFNASTYTFEQTAIADQYAAIDTNILSGTDARSFKLRTGKLYTVTVKDSEGKPYNKGLVNIAINEYIDGVYGTNTNARIVGVGTKSSDLKVPSELNHPENLCDDLGFYKIQTTTTKDGVVVFRIASDKVNDIATPIIWVDQDNASPLSGTRNGVLEAADPQKLLSQTIFVEQAVKSGAFSAALVNGDLNLDVDENDDVISIDGEAVRFSYKVRNQNGSAFMPVGSIYANLTYTITNNGNSPIYVGSPESGVIPVLGQQVTVDGRLGDYDVVTIPTHQTKTISFRTASASGNYIDIVADDEAKVSVTANANIVTETNTADGWLAPATAVASWILTTPVEEYAQARNMFSGTVFGYIIEGTEKDRIENHMPTEEPDTHKHIYDYNYVIVVPATDTSSYVKIPYFVADEYTVTTPQHNTPLVSDITEFENQITIDDGLTYKLYDSVPRVYINNNYVSLYNADNSYENLSKEVIPEMPELEISSALTQNGKDAVTTYAQETNVNVYTGTDAILVGNFKFGDRIFTPSAGMSTYAVATMIANASPITINGVAFNVITTDLLGGLKFTAALPDATEIDVLGAFEDTTNTGVQVKPVNSEVITNVDPALKEQVTITVNSATPIAQTVKVTIIDDDNVICESLASVIAGDSAEIVASKIRSALTYDLFALGYTVSGTGNNIVITKDVTGPADLQAIIE